MKSLNEYGVQELNFSELTKFDGGRSYWDHCKSAYTTLTDDFVGTLAMGLCPGPCLAAIAIGGAINYFNE